MNTEWTVEALVENLKSSDQFVRIHAATMLGSMGEDAEPAVPALIDLLENGDVQDRRLAALTLGEIGPAAEDALPALLESAEEEDESLDAMALEAIERIDSADDDSDADAAQTDKPDKRMWEDEETVTKLEMVQQALAVRGEATPEEIAAFIEQWHKVKIEPKFIPVYLATIRGKAVLEQSRRAARAVVEQAMADQNSGEAHQAAPAP